MDPNNLRRIWSTAIKVLSGLCLSMRARYYKPTVEVPGLYDPAKGLPNHPQRQEIQRRLLCSWLTKSSCYMPKSRKVKVTVKVWTLAIAPLT